VNFNAILLIVPRGTIALSSV